MDHGGFLDLFAGVDVLELRVGVFDAVGVVDAGDFGEVLWFGAISGMMISLCLMYFEERHHTSLYIHDQRFQTSEQRRGRW